MSKYTHVETTFFNNLLRSFYAFIEIGYYAIKTNNKELIALVSKGLFRK